MSRGRGKNPTSVAKQQDDGFRVHGGRGRRGWGGKLKPHELAKELLPNARRADDPVEKGTFILNEDELHERLTAMHHSYFKPGKPISVTFKDIGMENVGQLRKAFLEYDVIRNGKIRESKKLATATAVLLGLKE